MPAITFVINRKHPQYVGPLPVDEMAEISAVVAGSLGRCHDYLANVVGELGKREPPDPSPADRSARIIGLPAPIGLPASAVGGSFRRPVFRPRVVGGLGSGVGLQGLRCVVADDEIVLAVPVLAAH